MTKKGRAPESTRFSRSARRLSPAAFCVPSPDHRFEFTIDHGEHGRARRVSVRAPPLEIFTRTVYARPYSSTSSSPRVLAQNLSDWPRAHLDILDAFTRKPFSGWFHANWTPRVEDGLNVTADRTSVLFRKASLNSAAKIPTRVFSSDQHRAAAGRMRITLVSSPNTKTTSSRG